MVAELLPFLVGLLLVGLQATLDRVWLARYAKQYPPEGPLDDRTPVLKWGADTAQFIPASVPAILGIALLLVGDEEHRAGEELTLIIVLLLGLLAVIAVYVRAATRKLLTAETRFGLTYLQRLLIALNIAGLLTVVVLAVITGDAETQTVTCHYSKHGQELTCPTTP